MVKEKKKKRLWVQNLLNRYRMVVINETTFEEMFYLRISQFNIIVLIFLFTTFIALGSFFFVAYTPLKEFIPGYTSLSIRKEAIRNSFLLDSLSIEFEKKTVTILFEFSRNFCEMTNYYSGHTSRMQ